MRIRSISSAVFVLLLHGFLPQPFLGSFRSITFRKIAYNLVTSRSLDDLGFFGGRTEKYSKLYFVDIYHTLTCSTIHYKNSNKNKDKKIAPFVMFIFESAAVLNVAYIKIIMRQAEFYMVI